MSNLNFELNIYKYTNQELLNVLSLENNYNRDILSCKIISLKNNIFSLDLSSKEKNDIIMFLSMAELSLIKELEIKNLKKEQNKMKKKILYLEKKLKKKD